jgi:hypothetical protein
MAVNRNFKLRIENVNPVGIENGSAVNALKATNRDAITLAMAKSKTLA